jgi:hypothetical protein
VPSKTLCSPSISTIHDADDDFEVGGNAILAKLLIECRAWFVIIDGIDAASFLLVAFAIDIEFLFSDKLFGPQEHLAIHRVAPYHTSSRS